MAHLRAIVHICQKKRKVDFGADEILQKVEIATESIRYRCLKTRFKTHEKKT